MVKAMKISCMLSYRQQQLRELRAKLNQECDLYAMEALVAKITSAREVVEWHKKQRQGSPVSRGYSGWNEREWLLSSKAGFLFGAQ